MRLPHIAWKPVERTLVVLGGLFALIGLFFTVAQLHSANLATSADVLLRIDDRFAQSPYQDISVIVENGGPLLVKNGGHIIEPDLDSYLGLYETLYSLHSHGLVTDDMIWSNFSYDIEKTYTNPEVKSYLKELNAIDPNLFAGFQWFGEWVTEK